MTKFRADEPSDKQAARLHKPGGGGVRSMRPAPPPTRLEEWGLAMAESALLRRLP